MSDLPQPFGGYVLLKLLGSGVSGDVFLARPKEERPGVPSPVVIKRLHADLAGDQSFSARFRQESQIATAIDSAYVARVYDAGRVGPTFYIAMEYIAGWTLSRVLSDLRDAGAVATYPSIRDIISDTLDGLHALHNATDPETKMPLGVVHRDLAPKNMILGEDSVTRLIDLGIGKSAYQDWRTNTGVVMGSPGYMSPEQAAGHDVDLRSDLYSVGLVLWELITSRGFIDKAPMPVMLRSQVDAVYRPPNRKDVPKGLEAILQRALAREPEARFQSAKEMQLALFDALGPRAEGRVSSTMVGALLWGELGESKTEITELLSTSAISAQIVQVQSLPSEEEPNSDEDTEVFAEGSFTERPPAPLIAEPSTDEGDVAPVAPPPDFGPVSTDLPTERRGLPWSWVVGLMLLTLAAGILIASTFIMRPKAPVVLPVKVEGK